MVRSFLLIATLSVASSSVAAEPRDWEFVQSVGGIAVDQPTRGPGGWVLPVRANVSGIQTITVKPTLLNSALACKSVKASVEGQAIYLTVVTGVVGQRRTSTCPVADLGRLESGVYSVMYRSPDGKAVSLGDVTVGR